MIKLSELTKDNYTTGEVGRMLNLHPKTPYFWALRDEIKHIVVEGPKNRFLIPKDEVIRLLKTHQLLLEDDSRKDVIYARVSSHGQARNGDLDRQLVLDLEQASAYGLKGVELIKDIGSGLNTRRKGLLKLVEMVRNNEVSRVFISHKDRLTRFGFEYLQWFFEDHQTEIVVLEPDENKSPQEELVEDLLSLIASFSGRLYGIRAGDKKKLRQKIEEIQEEKC
ncbi:IS607 family transposase [Erysipelotrichaceae bacterium RD49]|nr:IS607 family transposase [Erysipelotrichaceae bacterium RD49]